MSDCRGRAFNRFALAALACVFLISALSAQTAAPAQSGTMVNPTSQQIDPTTASERISAANQATAATPAPLVGVWSNQNRFVEFSTDGKMRIVLKPYYGYVYEDMGWLRASAREEPADGAVTPSPHSYRVSLRYAGEKTDELVPLAVVGDGMYFRFFERIAPSDAVVSPESQTVGESSATGEIASPSGSSSTASVLTQPAAVPAAADIAGFWLASGNADALRLYRENEAEEFYSYYFEGSSYYRVRYWLTDARFRGVTARFDGPTGPLEIPKFLRIGESLYTCVTSTGTVLRNYEKGSFRITDGKISFKPDAVVYPGTVALYRAPIPCVISADKSVLAFGEPYLKKSSIADLDAEITKHNGLRRPPRKPIFGYMDLDFQWDEIARIRNNGKDPE